MPEIVVREKKSNNAPGFVYKWTCPKCGSEWSKFEYLKATILECPNCGKQILRTGKDKDEWETK
ncbi:MAG: hypothetical protein V1701_02750 [Planctomycetota bacterium]